MDPDQYRQLRLLFVEAEALEKDARHLFLQEVAQQYSDDIYQELMSLLSEHDPVHAMDEGSNPSSLRYIVSRGDPNESDTQRAPLSEPTLTPISDLPKAEITPLDPSKLASNFLLKSQTRKSLRRNNAWLWVTALLPTALIGWTTYYQVNSTMKQAVRDEMRGVSDSVSHAARRFLSDKSHLVESWTREPAIQSQILKLVDAKIEFNSDAPEVAEARNVITNNLERLSGASALRFAVWGNNSQLLTTNYSRIASKYIQRECDMQILLDRASQGEVVIFGPLRILGPEVESNDPDMGVITSIRDENDNVVATILVTKIGMYQEFSRMFFDIANAGNMDAYAIDQAGTMLTESPRAATLASTQRLDVTVEEIAASLRVSDPGDVIRGSGPFTKSRNLLPLTKAAKSVTGGRSDGEIQPYRNYAGIEVVGSWRWNSDSRIGIIVERPASQAFATVRIVQASFILLGSLLFLSVTIAAAFLARATVAERAAVHPLSRYEVIEEVGAGGMGIVYRAKHRSLGRETALKVMIGGTQKKEEQLRFDREARLAASLSNPHSVTIYDYGRSEDGESYCVMEFLKGLTLHEIVERSGCQPLGRVLFILRQVCEAVDEAHQKRLLHLDIKPQNIMLSLDQAVGDWAVLFDYGLSKPIAPTLDYYRNPIARWSGTPMYMAPERFHHLDQVDQRSDIYSLGCVGYYLATGATPFFDTDAESLFALIMNQQPINLATRRGEQVPREFTNLFIKCMAKNPNDRFQTVKDFVLAIETIQSNFRWTPNDSRAWWLQYGNSRKDEDIESPTKNQGS